MGKATSTPKTAAKLAATAGNSETFQALRALLSKHVPPLKVLSDATDRYELITPKPFHNKGIRKDNAYFGAIMIKKDYVGLYLMFIYDEPKNADKLGADLKKTLKGKSCFHIKKLDEILIKQIEAALEDGLSYYKKESAI